MRRLFAARWPEPEAGHESMTLGLDAFRDPKELRLDRLLTQPFRNDPAQRAHQNKSHVDATTAGR